MNRIVRLAAVATAAAALLAQTWRGALRGRVTDPSGASLASARARLVNLETNQERLTETGASGDFQLTALAPGDYRLEIERDNFRQHVQSVRVLVNQEVRADVQLAPGQRSESVDVTATRDLLRTDSAAVSTVIENRQVRELPLDLRNFYELSLLAPGVYPAAQGSATSVRGDFAVSVNGAREDSNLFLLDGVHNGDPKLNGFAAAPSVDAVREFEVLTSTYDASFGRNAGGQINVVLRGGTNRFHGTVYEFARNAAFDARNHFAPASEPDPKYQRHQFGFSLGGPIRKDRTFFFGDFEGRRLREGITRITNVPDALERQGDFSRSFRPPIDLFTQAPFPGNRIPAQRIHPVGRAIAALYPLPNRAAPGQNFVSSPAQRDDANSFDVRLDHRAGERSDIAARYSFGDRDLFEPFSGASFAFVPGYGNDVPRRSHNAMVSETHLFGPSLLNEARLAFNRVSQGVFQENRTLNLNQQVGLPTLSANVRDNGLSLISLPGFATLGHERNNPQFSATTSYQFIDQATWSAGNHYVKFGGDARLLRQNAYRDVLSRGFLTFFGLTGNPLGDLLQGIPTVTGIARLDNHQNLRTESYSLFVHDTWRVTPALALSLGVRYELTSPPVDVRDRANLYDPSRGILAPVGVGGIPRAGYAADRNNFAPRVGLAWSQGGSVIRGGYGIYYDQSALAPSEGLYFNAPYFEARLFAVFPGYLLTLSDPYPATYPVPVPRSAFTFDRNLRMPYMQHWNFTLQRQLGASRSIEAGYVGSKGTRLHNGRDINQPRPSLRSPNLRPNPLHDDITILESRGNSTYHSLQARFQQRFARGLSALASYTFGKSIDDASGFFASSGDANFPQDSLNVAAERGRSNFDVRHRLSLSYSYDLPIARTKWYGGWQTHGIWSFQTGRPFTVALLSDFDNSNTGFSALGFGAGDRPHALRDATLSDRGEARWFDTSAFAIPARGTFGNAGRNILDGPGSAVVNASVIKNTTIGESMTVQFRAEAFNLLNRTNLDLPDNFAGSPTFGRISSAQSPRRIQFGVKLLF